MAQLLIRYQPPPPTCFQAESTAGAPPAQENGVIGEFAPAFEVCETARVLRIQADVPGVRACDLSVYVVAPR